MKDVRTFRTYQNIRNQNIYDITVGNYFYSTSIYLLERPFELLAWRDFHLPSHLAFICYPLPITWSTFPTFFTDLQIFNSSLVLFLGFMRQSVHRKIQEHLSMYSAIFRIYDLIHHQAVNYIIFLSKSFLSKKMVYVYETKSTIFDSNIPRNRFLTYLPSHWSNGYRTWNTTSCSKWHLKVCMQVEVIT